MLATVVPLDFAIIAILAAAVAQVGGVIASIWNDWIQQRRLDESLRQDREQRAKATADHRALLVKIGRRVGVSDDELDNPGQSPTQP